jgi:hypothetical protein
LPWAAASRAFFAVFKALPAHHTPSSSPLHDLPSFQLERRADGAVLVRVASRLVDGRALPDAVFAFRAGDPQFAYWDDQLRSREVLPPSMNLPLQAWDADQNVG